MIFLFFQVGLFKVYSRLGFDQRGGKLLDWLFWSNLLEALTSDSYQMSYQVIWYCLGMREILNVPFDSIKYVTFSIPVILIRRLLSTGPLQKHSVNSDIFSKTRNCHLSNDCLCQNHHFRWLDIHENRQKLRHTNSSPTIYKFVKLQVKSFVISNLSSLNPLHLKTFRKRKRKENILQNIFAAQNSYLGNLDISNCIWPLPQ